MEWAIPETVIRTKWVCCVVGFPSFPISPASGLQIHLFGARVACGSIACPSFCACAFLTQKQITDPEQARELLPWPRCAPKHSRADAMHRVIISYTRVF